jgi:hypothetical protein
MFTRTTTRFLLRRAEWELAGPNRSCYNKVRIQTVIYTVENFVDEKSPYKSPYSRFKGEMTRRKLL